VLVFLRSGEWRYVTARVTSSILQPSMAVVARDFGLDASQIRAALIGHLWLGRLILEVGRRVLVVHLVPAGQLQLPGILLRNAEALCLAQLSAVNKEAMLDPSEQLLLWTAMLRPKLELQEVAILRCPQVVLVPSTGRMQSVLTVA